MATGSNIKIAILGDARQFQHEINEADRSLQGFGGKIAKFGKVAALGVAGLGVAAVGVGAGLFKLGESFDAEFDKIRVGTGATGDELSGLQDSFKNVLSSVPASFEDAGTAIADLNTRLGLTGKPLEDLAGQMVNLSRITDTELATNVDNLTRVFGDWGVAVGDQSAALDQIYRAAQASGIGLDDLSTSVVQFGAPLRNLGFGFDDSLALLAQFNKTGVNTSTVFAGMKAGVGKLAKAGEDVPSTFRRIVNEIKKLGPGSAATGKAIELFGQRAGPDLADAITGGKFELEGLLSAITGGKDTINGAAADTADFSEKWLLFKNRVLVGLQPLAAKVFDGVGVAMDKLGPYVGRVIAWFSSIIPVVGEVLANAFRPLKAWWDENGPAIVSSIKGYVTDGFGAITGWWERNKDTLYGYFAVFAAVSYRVFSVVAGWIKDTLLPALGSFLEWFVNNKYAVVGALAAIAFGFGLWAANAAIAAIATIVAFAPLIALGLAIAAVGAFLYYAYENWDWFRQGIEAVIPFMESMVSLAETLWGWLDKISHLDPLTVGGLKGAVRGLVPGSNLIPGFATGGMVPGPVGAPMIATVHGGERVLTPAQQRTGGGSGSTVINNFNIGHLDQPALGELLHRQKVIQTEMASL